jgi:hypothetical protein
MESRLDKVLRLAQVPVKQYQRVQAGKVQNVRQSTQNRQPGVAPGQATKFGAAYHTSWGSISTGDVIEFAPGDLWQVIPVNQYPGYKPSTSSGVSTGSGSGTTGSGSSTSGTTVGAGTSGATSTSGTGTASASSTGNATSSYYLRNWYNKQRYATLTLPDSTVVMVMPVIP